MRILVTGGAGFIGSHIVDALVDRGHRVTVLDDLSSGQEENLNRRAKFIKGDVTSPKKLESVFKRVEPEAIFHLAAQINVRASVENPTIDAECNILGSLRLIEMAAKAGVKKFIFSSTGGAMFGDDAHYPAHEDESATPLSPYGLAKLTIEKYLDFYHRERGLPYIALRYGNVYGPRQNPHGEAGVIAIFTSLMLDGKAPIINGDGTQTRDYVYVGDVVKANIAALESEIEEGVFHIGTGKETDVNEIFRLVNWQFGKAFEATYGPAKSGEVKRSALDARKAEALLNWKPEVDISEGITATVTWFKARLREE
jgi:UDP-glucose 4-epimerase